MYFLYSFIGRSPRVLWFANRGRMGYFVTGAAADHVGGAKARKDRARASDTVYLLKSIIEIGFLSD